MGMLDWQAAHWGRGIRDVVYFLNNALPSEVLARNFWFCTIDDPRTLDASEHALVAAALRDAIRLGEGRSGEGGSGTSLELAAEILSRLLI